MRRRQLLSGRHRCNGKRDRGLDRSRRLRAGGVFLSAAGYGCLRFLVDQGDDTFQGATHGLTLDRVAHVPRVGRHNPLSVKRPIIVVDPPMRVYLATATIRPRNGLTTPVFLFLSPERGVVEIKLQRRGESKKILTMATRSLVTARSSLQHIMDFYRLIGHPSEDIMQGTARIAGVKLTGTWSPCAQCS